MKSKLLVLCTIVSIAGAGALAQTTGGGAASGASGGTGSGISGGTGASGATTGGAQQGSQINNNQNLPPGLQNRQQLPPGLSRREQLPPGLQRIGTDSAQFGVASTNAAGGAQAGIIGGDTNRVPMTPNPAAGSTGSFNQRSATTPTRAMQDKAFTAEDQRLLVQVRKQVLPILNVTEGTTPVNFTMQNGVVTLVGSVPTAQHRQRIVTLIERTPGVTQVVDQLQLGTDTSTLIGSAGVSGSSLGTNTTSAIASTSAMGTNLSATSRARGTNRIYSGTNQLTNPELTPPSDQILQNRPNQGSLPPGLQNRDQIPPGVERRGNSTTGR